MAGVEAGVLVDPNRLGLAVCALTLVGHRVSKLLARAVAAKEVNAKEVTVAAQDPSLANRPGGARPGSGASSARSSGAMGKGGEAASSRQLTSVAEPDQDDGGDDDA